MPHPSKPLLRIGHCLTSKKTNKLQSQGLGFFNETQPIQYDDVPYPCQWVHVDITQPIPDDLQIDVLLLKVTDWMAAVKYGTDEQMMAGAKHLLAQLEQWIADHPRVLVTESLQRVWPMVSRDLMHAELQRIEWKPVQIDRTAVTVAIPERCTVQVSNADQLRADLAALQLPIVFKPCAACGSAESHQLYVINDWSDLQHIAATQHGKQFVASEYISHDAQIYKVYKLAAECCVSVKPSTPNLVADSPSMQLDSQSMKLTAIHSGALQSLTTPNGTAAHAQGDKPRLSASDMQSILEQIGQQLTEHFQLHLLGFDVIVDSTDHTRLYIVDVNYFPSYRNVDDLQHKLIRYITSLHTKQHNALTSK